MKSLAATTLLLATCALLAGGTAIEAVAAPTPSQIVAITGPQPLPLLVGDGTSVTFTASFTGPATDIHWFKDSFMFTNQTTTSQTSSSLTLSYVFVNHAGLYKMRVIGPVNTVYTVPVQLAVVNLTNVIVPVGNNATMTLYAPVNGTGLTFQWLRNDVPLAKGDLGGRITNPSLKTLTVPKFTFADEASFACVVSLGAQQVTSGVMKARACYKPELQVKSSLPSWIACGTVDLPISSLIQQLNSQAQDLSYSYLITGLPAGLKYDKRSGRITGKLGGPGTGWANLKITATNAAGPSTPAAVSLVIAPLPAQAMGEFRGLVDRGDVNGSLGAALNVSISSSGIVSGKFMHGTAPLAFKGVLNAVAGSSTVTASIPVLRRAPLPPLQLTLSINGATGALTGAELNPSLGQTSSLVAWHNPWKTTAPANLATAYAGTYTAAFRITTGQNPNPIGTESYPQGDGYALLKVTTAGVVTGTCRLADATSISVSTLLGPQGQIGLYLPAYGNTGSALGWQQIVPDVSDIPASYANNPLDGTLAWYKAPPVVPTSTRSYNLGIPLHNLTVIGGAWRKPAALVLGLTDTNVNNASLVFTLAGINETNASGHTAQLTLPFRLKAPTNTFIAPVPNSAKLSLAVNATSGQVSGRWTTRDTNPIPPGQIYDRTAYYYGAIVTRLALGTGHFNLPRPPTTGKTTVNTDILSGKMEFQPHP